MHVKGNLAAVNGWLEALGDITDELGCREPREVRLEGSEEGWDGGGKGSPFEERDELNSVWEFNSRVSPPGTRCNPFTDSKPTGNSEPGPKLRTCWLDYAQGAKE